MNLVKTQPDNLMLGWVFNFKIKRRINMIQEGFLYLGVLVGFAG